MSEAAKPVEEITTPAVIAALSQVFDPEIPVNIFDLGLIYEIDIKPDNSIDIKMTLTAPNCPAAGELPKNAQEAVENIPGVTKVDVELVWEPPWSKDCMSEDARLALGIF